MKNSIKHTNKILSVLFAFLFISLNIQADDISSKEIKVSGIVQDQTGVELPGVSISVKGIDKGTITNASGEFSIMVSPDATLIVSFVGMETKEIADFLKEEGCSEIQGFLYYRPMCCDDFEKLIQQSFSV